MFYYRSTLAIPFGHAKVTQAVKKTIQDKPTATNKSTLTIPYTMKTTPTLTISALILSIFLSIGAHVSFAQPKIEVTTSPISFLSVNRLAEPLDNQVRVRMLKKIISTIKQDVNKKVPDVRLTGQKNQPPSAYYEYSGDLSGRKLTIQYLPTQDGTAGNTSFDWDEKNEKNKFIEKWFVSLSFTGVVEVGIDPQKIKVMTTSDKKENPELKKFWQLQADQLISELCEIIDLTGEFKAP